ncbi:MAG: adenylate/guanylate cyclase domain-containing protein [Desulfobacteraceae bacterium]|jgi:adenylate cyclase
MSLYHTDQRDPLFPRSNGLIRRLFYVRFNGYPDRRSGRDRRSGEDRRIRQEAFSGPDRRSGKDRRRSERRAKYLRIPIFIKLATLSTLLIFLVISTIGFSILTEQKKRFTGQLVDLGQSMVRIASNNAPDKILGEEDLALFQLVRDIAENEQVVYALVTDHKSVIKAHSRIDEVGKLYSEPKEIQFLRKEGETRTSTINHDGEECLFFESPVTYQDLKVGEVRLAISKKRILQNIQEAKVYFVFLAIIMTLVGILLSLGLSMYFSRPIRQLGEITRALGMGEFNCRIRVNRNDEFGDLAYAFNRMAEDLELKEKIKDSFGRYVTPEIVEMILSNPDKLWMKGSKVRATVLFVDIRGFTTLSENMDPEAVVRLLNDYLTRVTDTVIKYGGHINKFVGDEAMAIFGAPIINPHHAEAAVKAALDIQEQIVDLNREKLLEDVTIGVGVGLNSGEMVAGNLGSERRMEYTVVGDNVNVASRLTALAKAGEILISKRTYDLIRDKSRLKVEERGKAPVRGRRRQITIYRVFRLQEMAYGGLGEEVIQS